MVDELHRVALLGLFDRVVGYTGSHIRYTRERVVGDDRLHD